MRCRACALRWLAAKTRRNYRADPEHFRQLRRLSNRRPHVRAAVKAARLEWEKKHPRTRATDLDRLYHRAWREKYFADPKNRERANAWYRNRRRDPAYRERNGFDPVAAVDRALAERAARKITEPEQLSLDLPKSRRKLNLELARHIRRLHAAYQWSHRELGEQFGVSHRTIGYVVTNQIYREERAGWPHEARIRSRPLRRGAAEPRGIESHSRAER
jgi:hypothetical protein